MAYYPDDFKDYLKGIANVSDVIQSISGHVTPAGNHHVALCPFHEDDSPSLMISNDSNSWSCLACKAGSRFHSRATSSDVFGFIMGYFQMNLGQAIEWLANYYQVALPVLNEEQKFEQSKHLWWINRTTAIQTRFANNLIKDESAYRYLRNRGIDDLAIATWGLGVGDDEDLEFKNTANKIAFPIYNLQGDIISFTGRVPFGSDVLAELNEKQKLESKRITPKYDHQWELKEGQVAPDYLANHPYPKFEKSKMLYGLHIAKHSIRQWKKAVIVEGFTDTIQLHRHGISNAVASLGISLTEEQALLLKRSGAQTVVLMRDGDVAGIRGMQMDADILMKHGLRVEVCPLPTGHDPDTLAQQFSIATDEMARYITKHTKTLPQWRVEVIYRDSLNDLMYHYSQIHEMQSERMEKVIYTIGQEPDPIERDILIRQYADLFNISVEAMKDKLKEVV